jgi:sulfite reductase beta subunit-like hemoprotein
LEQSITCVGKSTCNLGILESPVLMKSILKHFRNKKRLSKYLPTLRISGCPNSCGAQQLGALGFWGKKKQGIEYYTIMAKGNFQGEIHVLNKNIGEIKASLIPEFLEALAIKIRDSGKTYKELVDEDVLERLLEKYSE